MEVHTPRAPKWLLFQFSNHRQFLSLVRLSQTSDNGPVFFFFGLLLKLPFFFFKNFSKCQTVHSKCKYLTKHNQNRFKSQKAVILFIPESPHFKCSNKTVNIGAVTRECRKNITKSFCSWCWAAIWHKSQMPNWAGLTLGQIPHCMEQNSGQMPGVCPGWGGGGEMGGYGIDWCIAVLSTFKTTGKTV